MPMIKDEEQLSASFQEFTEDFRRLKDEIQKEIVGYDALITDTLTAIFSRGHVLLEGVPGLGKTFLVKVISDVVGIDSGRVQCTPDLMPADILGTQIVQEDGEGRRSLRFEKGPVFRNIVLVDEINRATPKTQAALLEVMQEQTVTSGGKTYSLPHPFFVLATQNPIEMEGTYPLPEAQLDRFLFKVRVPFPDRESLMEISRRTTGAGKRKLEKRLTGEQLQNYQELVTQVPVADPITAFAADLVLATHPDEKNASEKIKRYVAYGSSPRGLQALIRGAKVRALLDGRSAVAIDDVRAVARVALRHRVILNFEGEAESIDIDRLLEEILEKVPTPAQAA